MEQTNIKVFRVTGEHHGSIVYADTVEEAIKIFNKNYPNEEIWSTKDISNYNLENL